MNILKAVLEIIDKLKAFIAYFLGFQVGKKVQRLEDDVIYLKIKEKALKHKASKEARLLDKWARIRKDALRVVNPANQPQLRGEQESVIKLSDAPNDEVRTDRD